MSLAISSATYLLKLGITTDPSTFGLHVSRPPGATSNTVTWTWPPGMVNGINAQTVIFYQLTLQRSTSASYRPSPFVVYDVASNQAPAVDPHWAELTHWNFTQFQADTKAQGTGYVDPWPTANGPVVYRLILNFAKVTDPVQPPFGEMTWNVALCVPPYTMFQPTGTTTVNLSWTAPQDLSWWPPQDTPVRVAFAAWSFIAGQNPGCAPGHPGYSHIVLHWPLPGPQPVNYRLFKTDEVTPANWNFVYDFGPGTQVFDTGIYDDCDTNNPTWYYFTATLSNGSMVDSTVVGGTH